MGFLLRDKRDGRRTAGYGIYLIGGIGVFAVVAVLNRRVGESGHSFARPPEGRPAAAARSNGSPTGEFPGSPDSGIRSTVPGGGRPGEAPGSRQARSPDESFDAISAALARPPSDAPPARPGEPVYQRLPPAFPPDAPAPQDRRRGDNPTHAGPQGQAPEASLLGYRDASADSAAVRRRPAGEPPVPAAPDFRVPKGTLISVYLLTDVDTGNAAATIQFGAAKSLYFNHREQIPFGTRFLGRFSGQVVRDRVTLTADTILYPDGLELPVDASAVEADEAGASIYPGIAAYYFPPPAWAQAAPYISEFVTGYLGLLESRGQPQLTVTAAGLGIQPTGAADPRVPLYQSSAQAIEGFTESRLKEIEQRYASHYLVPAGTAFWLELTSDLDLSAAHAPAAPPLPDPPMRGHAPSLVSAQTHESPAN